MHPRFYPLAQAFRSSRSWVRSGRPVLRHRVSQFLCRSCLHKFSTSSMLRKISQATQIARNRKYPRQLVIYQAGDLRTAFVSFWKGTAIFQFGTATVFLAPFIYKNEKQPDRNVRLLQTVGVIFLAAMPMMAMSYLTAPFVKRVAIELPEYACYSRESLMKFSRNLRPQTRLEFTTLRAFPFERNTGVFLSELRALPPQKGRFANIELPKTKEWRQRQKEKRFLVRFWEVVKEPRFKFYVKEGRSYTIQTGVPGVWENVAWVIQQQTVEAAAKEAAPKGTKNVRFNRPVKPLRIPSSLEGPKIRRQTSRPPR